MNNVQTRGANPRAWSSLVWNTGDELEFLYPSAIFDVLDKLYSRMPRCYLLLPAFRFLPSRNSCAPYITNNLEFFFFFLSSFIKKIEFLMSVCNKFFYFFFFFFVKEQLNYKMEFYLKDINVVCYNIIISVLFRFWCAIWKNILYQDYYFSNEFWILNLEFFFFRLLLSRKFMSLCNKFSYFFFFFFC